MLVQKLSWGDFETSAKELTPTLYSISTANAVASRLLSSEFTHIAAVGKIKHFQYNGYPRNFTKRALLSATQNTRIEIPQPMCIGTDSQTPVRPYNLTIAHKH